MGKGILGNIDYPPPGCSRTANDNTSSSLAGVETQGLFGTGATAGLKTSSRNQSDQVMCNPDYKNSQINSTKNNRSSSVNNDTLIMSKNSLKSISESTNQMIVNSISSMKSNSSQTVEVLQNIKLKITGVAGDVTVKGIKNESNIEMVNLAEISLDAFDNIKTDLATSVLNSFKNNTNVESMNTLSANLETSAANQTDATLKLRNDSKVDKEQKTQFPAAAPNTVHPPNTSANVNIQQENYMENNEINNVSNRVVNDISTERIMETHINNSVTQNFTKESISQLSQYLKQNQNIEITIEDVGGNVSVTDISNATNIVLRQTLQNKMNVGNAIVNSVVNTMGLETDDGVASKSIQDAGLTSKTDLRNGITSKADLESTASYSEKVTQDLGFGCGSSGSSLIFFCIPCIICIVCVLSVGAGGLTATAAASGIASSESPTDKLQPGEEIDNSDSSNSTNSTESSDGMPNSSESLESIDSPGTSVGGYYYFD